MVERWNVVEQTISKSIYGGMVCDVCAKTTEKHIWGDGGWYYVKTGCGYSTDVVHATVCSDACLVSLSQEPKKYLKHESVRVVW